MARHTHAALAGHRSASESVELDCHLASVHWFAYATRCLMHSGCALGIRRALSSSEIYRRRIAATQQNSDVLAGLRLITTRKKCCKGGSTSGLGDYPQGLPESHLCTLDLVVGNKDHVVDMPLGDGVNEGPNPAWRK